MVETSRVCDASAVALLRALFDGLVTIRPSASYDTPALIGGRDQASRRFLGDGDPAPHPAAVIVVDDLVVGWVDYDHDRSWLEPDEINLGYNVFPPHRGNGHATRAVRLLMQYLAADTQWRVATLLIDPANDRSLAVARRLAFTQHGDLDGNPYWKQPILHYPTPHPDPHAT